MAFKFCTHGTPQPLPPELPVMPVQYLVLDIRDLAHEALKGEATPDIQRETLEIIQRYAQTALFQMPEV